MINFIIKCHIGTLLATLYPVNNYSFYHCAHWTSVLQVAIIRKKEKIWNKSSDIIVSNGNISYILRWMSSDLKFFFLLNHTKWTQSREIPFFPVYLQRNFFSFIYACFLTNFIRMNDAKSFCTTMKTKGEAMHYKTCMTTVQK